MPARWMFCWRTAPDRAVSSCAFSTTQSPRKKKERKKKKKDNWTERVGRGLPDKRGRGWCLLATHQAPLGLLGRPHLETGWRTLGWPGCFLHMLSPDPTCSSPHTSHLASLLQNVCLRKEHAKTEQNNSNPSQRKQNKKLADWIWTWKVSAFGWARHKKETNHVSCKRCL